MFISRIVPFCVAAAITTSFAVLDLPNAQPKVDAAYWNAALDSTWQGLIRRNIQPYSAGVGLIHRPKSEAPGDAVSEGVGYGMLVALYANDQASFNKMWDEANSTMWGKCYYNWQMSVDGTIVGMGAASDAEEDVALALIFADKLVSAGKWKAYTSTKFGYDYKTHAQKILDCMWSTEQVTRDGILAPGAGWGGNSFVNPGYFSPAWYKIFAKFDSNGDRWNKVVDKSYEIISKSPGYSMGMVPDWMTPEGGWVGAGLGYNAYFDSKGFFKDAIRILWRVAIDAIWFDEQRAKTFLKNALTFINSKGGPKAANFYQIENAGELLPAEDKWYDFNNSKDTTTWRYRREHSHLTIGMWATAAMAVGEKADRIAFSEEMGKFYEGRDYFGKAKDESGALEDTLHNEMYFDQFLAWFGTSMMSGAFVNVIDAIDNPKTATVGDFSSLTPSKISVGRFATVTGLKVNHLDGAVLMSVSENANWSIFDLNGQMVVQSAGKDFLWNTRGQSGIYIVKAVSRNRVYSRKISVR
ncbi:MAG: T9SS type A sorting domain-containing protein [Fibrobacter sp.]|nr:T9SS type A sorting domain-containing protein [Fibrobacter sp.]